jgi:photoactive yellow protein
MPHQDLPSFDTPRLARAVERLLSPAIDRLPFGAIRLDPEGRVTFYSATERRLSGYHGVGLGQSFFAEMAPCMDNDEFRGRIDAARAAGRLDIAFGYVSHMPSGQRDVELDVRVQSASDGGCWVFLKREG